MSKVINPGDKKPGSIYRIALENFVTFKQVVLYPGPALNLIIGPNGTGKSTFVCAIILGLCGKTNVIGRAKKVGEFVRAGCEAAVVELELWRGAGERNVVVTRRIDTASRSTFHLDHKPATEAQMRALVASLNIQVDNLCGMLPQDRVQDFSKMDAVQLLRSTLAAAAPPALLAALDRLVQLRAQHRTHRQRLLAAQQQLQECIRLNDGLRGQVEALRERAELDRELELVACKVLWVEYSELRDQFAEHSRDKRAAEALVARLQAELQPLQDAISSAAAELQRLDTLRLAKNKEVMGSREQLHAHMRAVRAGTFSVRERERDAEELEEAARARAHDLHQARLQLDKLTSDLRALQETSGDESSIKMQLAELRGPLVKSNTALERLKKERMEAQGRLQHEAGAALRLARHHDAQQLDAVRRREQALQAASRDAHHALLWLRQNKDTFHHPVYEPLMLEIKFEEARVGGYVESVVARRDLVAFTFEDAGDMNRFTRVARDQLRLRTVNALCSPPCARTYAPPCRLDDIRGLGFYSWLREALVAPAAVLRYLCRMYAVHRIPLGTDATYSRLDRVPTNLPLFFTKEHRVSSRVSRYSGARSTNVSEVPAPRLLLPLAPPDPAHQHNVQRAGEQRAALEGEVRRLEQQIAALNGSIADLTARAHHLNSAIDAMSSLALRVQETGARAARLERECAADPRDTRAQCTRRTREAVRALCTLHARTLQLVRRAHTAQHTLKLLQVQAGVQRQVVAQREADARQLLDQQDSAKQTLEKVVACRERSKENARRKLAEARAASGGRLYDDAAWAGRAQLERLPRTLPELHARAAQAQARLACLPRVDPAVVKEFEDREQQVAALRLEAEQLDKQHALAQADMDQLSAGWVSGVEALVARVNEHFSAMFARLHCAGEVKLVRDGADEDYERYGIGVLVRWREGEEMAQLNRHSQSGGERALTTALYLCALQALAGDAVPFRCVDEINQGMDEANERKLFQLLVETIAPTNHQYFLLTPKLLGRLQYGAGGVTVHTIMNGRRLPRAARWRLRTFLEHAAGAAGANVFA